uniref:Uncharacterized protein n=1 Tax=Salvator merianae TaxID=96440 RepID=A0A8D0C748_SALMN
MSSGERERLEFQNDSFANKNPWQLRIFKIASLNTPCDSPTLNYQFAQSMLDHLLFLSGILPVLGMVNPKQEFTCRNSHQRGRLVSASSPLLRNSKALSPRRRNLECLLFPFGRKGNAHPTSPAPIHIYEALAKVFFWLQGKMDRLLNQLREGGKD